MEIVKNNSKIELLLFKYCKKRRKKQRIISKIKYDKI